MTAATLCYLGRQHTLLCPSVAVVDRLKQIVQCLQYLLVNLLLHMGSSIIYYKLFSIYLSFILKGALLILLLRIVREPSKNSPHYLWIIYLPIYLLAKVICNPQISTHGAFMVIHIWMEWWKNWVTWGFSAEIKWGDALPSCFISYYKQVSFSQSI